MRTPKTKAEKLRFRIGLRIPFTKTTEGFYNATMLMALDALSGLGIRLEKITQFSENPDQLVADVLTVADYLDAAESLE